MSSGSLWHKWDLHVHTPDSIVHNYPGEREHAWEAFINDLENLPCEFKVIGVNDYLFVDGYERLLQEKANNRLENIDLFLPVVELRLDKFAGTDGNLERVNLHVIFDSLPADEIRTHFINALAKDLMIDPKYADTASEWHAIPTRDTLEELGTLIINSVPDAEKKNFGSPLKEGFSNLNFSFDKIKEILRYHRLKDRYLIALGKTEWSAISWNSQSIADKKNLINSADCVFTASESPEAYHKARQSLRDQEVNDRLLDCSDAHWLSTESDKDRIGNCNTWIKAQPSFLGLRHALLEFEKRVFVGDLPEKLAHVNRHPSRYIQSVSIKPTAGVHSGDVGWFNCELGLNPGMVAVVGNKGSGKSALLDTLGLLGDSSNEKYFSFLNRDKFRHARKNLANKFDGTLYWASHEESAKNLGESVSDSADERVRYLPQQYIEKLCNELKGITKGDFVLELRNIVFSHVKEADRLGYDNIDDLLEFATKALEEEIEQLRDSVSEANKQIISIEAAASPARKEKLNREKARIESEIAAHQTLKPEEVEKPSEDNSLTEALSADLEKATGDLIAVQAEIEQLRNRQVELTRKTAVAQRLIARLGHTRTQIDDLQDEIYPDLTELGLADSAEQIMSLRIDLSLLQERLVASEAENTSVAQTLESSAADGVISRQSALSERISSLKSQLAEPQRKFIAYQEALRTWEQTLAAMVGTPDTIDTLEYVKDKLAGMDKIPQELEAAKENRIALVSDVHSKIAEIAGIYRVLYHPITEFLAEFNAGSDSMPITFAAEIVDVGFGDRLWELVNRQFRGSFSGREESEARLRTILQDIDFNDKEDVIRFVKEIDRQFHEDTRDGVSTTEITPVAQLRKGKTLEELYDAIYQLSYLESSYLLKFGDKSLEQLSPGERGLLLLIFYLLVDKGDIPLIVDQPEENLDNQTIYETLVRAVTSAVKRRQVIVATHSANVAVVCDADQIIRAKRDSETDVVTYDTGCLEDPPINAIVVDVLEGTKPAFRNRKVKYRE